MKAKDVMRVFGISRPTLYRYRKEGKIKARTLPNGQYDYDGDDVFFIRNGRHVERKTILYGRVSTYQQKHDLDNQMKELHEFAVARGYQIDYEFKDIASGINYNRKEFNKMLNIILNGEAKRIIITHRDRLSRTDFETMEFIMNKFQTELIVISDEMNEKTDEQELFAEIIRLLHSFSMKYYAKRKAERMKLEQKLQSETH